MPTHDVAAQPEPARPASDEVLLIASGDLRPSANQVCWPAQERMEEQLGAALARFAKRVRRAHAYDPAAGHGFISSQRMGLDVFRTSVHPDSPLIVAEAVWQYSHHVLGGLRDHRGPILTVANWEGEWPGLVGLLNLNASLTKAKVPYSTLWSETFDDSFFLDGLETWLAGKPVIHDTSHVRDLERLSLPPDDEHLGRQLATTLRRERAIIGVFDEGCMGMYNAIFDDEYLNPIGLYKERLSQSALLAEMHLVESAEVDRIWSFLQSRGMAFDLGEDDATELTRGQIEGQLRMYVAAARLADAFGCEAIGIQYQQGLKDMCPASDLAEGLLNNTDRPAVYRRGTSDLIRPGSPIPHFNEVDEGAAVDMVITARVWRALGFPTETTLHDIRWGEPYNVNGESPFVWVFEISGAVPPAHLEGGYDGATSERQPPMYFPLGGGTIKGVSRPGEIVWSRFYLEDDELCVDLGRGSAITLPEEETERRWRKTTPQWPMMHAVLHGISRDQMMAKHKANHINVAYAPSAPDADRALRVKAALCRELGIRVRLCGAVPLESAV